MTRALRLLAAAAALVLAACGNTTLTRLAYANAAFAYGNFASMATWTLDDYFDLSDTQEDWVRERAGRLQEWHRTQELPRYRRFLEYVLAKSDAPWAAEDVAAQYAAVRTHYHRAVEQMIPDFAELLGSIEPAQAGTLERKFADENAKFVRESIRGTPEERREKRERRFVSHIEAWVGTLREEQVALVDAHYREIPDLSDEMLGERRYRQSEILALARARPPREQLQAQLHKLLVETDSWRRPEYLKALKDRDARSFAMIARLSATLSEEQRAALQARIRGFLRDISALTAAS